MRNQLGVPGFWDWYTIWKTLMPAQTIKLVEQALARLDAAGDGGSAAACDLQIALAHLGASAGLNELASLEARLWRPLDTLAMAR